MERPVEVANVSMVEVDGQMGAKVSFECVEMLECVVARLVMKGVVGKFTIKYSSEFGGVCFRLDEEVSSRCMISDVSNTLAV